MRCLRWPIIVVGVCLCLLLLATLAAAAPDDGYLSPKMSPTPTPTRAPTATATPHRAFTTKESTAAAAPAFTYFDQTGHSVSGPMLAFYNQNNGKDAYGLPLTEVVRSGNRYLQIFERAVIEVRPDEANTPDEFSLVPLAADKNDAAPGRTYATAHLATYLLAPVSRDDLVSARQLQIPSLMFHYVRVVANPKADPLGFNLSVTPANFVRFLDWLDESGYTTVTIGQIADHMRYGIPLPARAVNLRFDDGYESHWFVYQELRKRHMTATFFVISQWLHLNPAQWQQIDADGFEVAPHTRHHIDLKAFSAAKQIDEIAGSKTDMEAMLGHKVRTFAYPYGSYDDTAVQAVLDAGFSVAVTTQSGYGWRTGDMLLQPTLTMRGDDTVAGLIAKVQNLKPAAPSYVPRFANGLSDIVGQPATTPQAATDGARISSNSSVPALLDLSVKPYDATAQAAEVERRWLQAEATGDLTRIPDNTEPNSK